MEAESEKLYQCSECGLSYSDKELAKKCQQWCESNHSCNLEVTKHSINKEAIKEDRGS